MTISTTPIYGFPWPNSDEAVTNGWDAIRDLAVAMEAKMVRGRVAYLERVAAIAAGGVDLDVVILPAFTMTTGRRYRVEAQAAVQRFTTGDVTSLRIFRDAVLVSEYLVGCSATVQAQSGHMGIPVVGDGVSHVWKLSAIRLAGASNLAVAASATSPCWLSITDEGAS